MNHEKELRKLVKSLSGNIICIGMDSKLVLDEIERNDNIYNCTLLDSLDVTPVDGKKKRNKSINVRKFRKKFKKKRTDTIICRMENMHDYLKYFIKDSVYMTKGQVIYYGTNEEFLLDEDEFVKRYARYKKTETKIVHDKDGMMIYVTMNGAKPHRVKDKFYFVRDTMYNAIQLLGDYMVQ